MVIGPGGSQAVDGRLDTAADDTVFPLWVLPMIGADPAQAVEQQINLVGRGQPVRARVLPVELRITDGQETYQWPTLVAFAPIALRRALLGYTGFLQFFDADFRGADCEGTLTPNRSFPGRRI